MTIRFLPTPIHAGGGDWRVTARAQQSARRSATIVPALVSFGAAKANQRLLLEGGALAVTTGQQAGLFTGPLYAVYKALSAAALAREMADAGLGSVVPVFWVAGDDHDFAEINHCTVIGGDGRPVRILLRERPAEAPMLPAYREPVGVGGAAALAALEAALPPSDARAGTMDWLSRAYTPERSVAEAHTIALAELLAPYGVVVCRGWHGALKTAANDVLLRAARDAEAIDADLAAEADRLRSRGAAVPVDVGQGLSLLMVEGVQGRDRLRIAGPGRFETRRGLEAFTLEDLERIGAEQPERLSGNVLLRPAVEAAVFPTVGYFGGPGELAYLEQTGPVFARLDVPRPARLARLSGLLVEAKVDKVLEKHQLSPADLAASESALASRIARDALPESTVSALGELRRTITERYAAVQADAIRVDKTLEKPVENARNQALMGSQEIEKRIVAALKRTGDTAIQQVARARDQLFPGGTPQERVVCSASFLARHGPPVLDLVFEAARQHVRRHLEAPPVTV
jgi:bacillithiol biosynthesis cysteine-adding enzyme BshC